MAKRTIVYSADRELERGTEVRVYRNLNARCLSVQVRTDKGWRVACHAKVVHLVGARFKVSEAGRQRVLRERRKNVHAYIEGTLTSYEQLTAAAELDGWSRGSLRTVRYSPYVGPRFYLTDHERKTRPELPVRSADFVTVCSISGEIQACGITLENTLEGA